ncbi:MAG: hypothetical protein DRG83_00155 [Deltaproteobacteria bacterium]|nr:MAG: hypothetical protein DRG83_00155 [Deltaproteobacteria bacterium]
MNQGLISEFLTGFLMGSSEDPLSIMRFLEERRRQNEQRRLRELQMAMEQERLRMQQERLRLAEEAAKRDVASFLAGMGIKPSAVLEALKRGELPELKPEEVIFGAERPLTEELPRLMTELPYIEDITVKEIPATLRGKPYVPSEEAYIYEPTPAEGEFKPPKTELKAKISPYQTPEQTRRAVLAKLREIIPRDKWQLIVTGKTVPTTEDIVEKYKTLKEAAVKISKETGTPQIIVEETLGLPVDPFAKKDIALANMYTRLKRLFGDKYSDDELLMYAFAAVYGGGKVQLGKLEDENVAVSWRTFSQGPYKIMALVRHDKKTGKPLGMEIFNVDFDRNWIQQQTNNLSTLGAKTSALDPDTVGRVVAEASKVIWGNKQIPLGSRNTAWSMYISTARQKNPAAVWSFLYATVPAHTVVGQHVRAGLKRWATSNVPDRFAPEQIIGIQQNLQKLSTLVKDKFWENINKIAGIDVENLRESDIVKIAKIIGKPVGKQSLQEYKQRAQTFQTLYTRFLKSINEAPEKPDQFAQSLKDLIEFLEKEFQAYQEQ